MQNSVRFFYFSTFFVLYITFGTTEIYGQSDSILAYLKHRENAVKFRDFVELINEPTNVSGTVYTDYHSSIKKPYLFNGDFQLPFTFGGKKYTFGKKNSCYQVFQFAPEIKVRIFQNDPIYKDKSKPVRTPSYIPKISYFLTNNRFWQENFTKRYYIGISALHHSNGGDGWEFDYSDSSVNIYNGSFSESLYFHWFIGGLYKTESNYTGRLNHLVHAHKKKNRLLIESAEIEQHNLAWKFGLETHPRYFSDQKFYDSKLYGGNRLFLNMVYLRSHLFNEYYRENGIWNKLDKKQIKEVDRFSLQVEYITDLSYRSGNLALSESIQWYQSSKRLNISLCYYRRLLDSKYLAVFGQLAYYGSDNYNIYFQHSSFVARIGLAFGLFEFHTLH